MYEAPKLEPYGTFRELTEGGGGNVADPFTADTTDNCFDNGAGTVVCHYSH